MLIILPIDSASRFYRQRLTFDTRSGQAAEKTSKTAAGGELDERQSRIYRRIRNHLSYHKTERIVSVSKVSWEAPV